jgi:hypothetical protein
MKGARWGCRVQGAKAQARASTPLYALVGALNAHRAGAYKREFSASGPGGGGWIGVEGVKGRFCPCPASPPAPIRAGAFGAKFRDTGTAGDADFARGLAAQIGTLGTRPSAGQTAGIGPKAGIRFRQQQRRSTPKRCH